MSMTRDDSPYPCPRPFWQELLFCALPCAVTGLCQLVSEHLSRMHESAPVAEPPAAPAKPRRKPDKPS